MIDERPSGRKKSGARRNRTGLTVNFEVVDVLAFQSTINRIHCNNNGV